MGLGGGSAVSSSVSNNGSQTSSTGLNSSQGSNPLGTFKAPTGFDMSTVQAPDPLADLPAVETYKQPPVFTPKLTLGNNKGNALTGTSSFTQDINANLEGSRTTAQQRSLTQANEAFNQAQGADLSENIQQTASNKPLDTLMSDVDKQNLPYDGRALNVAKGLNTAYEGLLKIPRFIYGLAAVPQNALSSALNMPELAANYDDFLKNTNTPVAQSPLTMLDQLGNYYGKEADSYGERTKKYDENITSSLVDGKWKQAGNQILDQIAESAPSIAVMAMTAGAGNTAKLGQVSKTLANALPFMSQQNAALQDDKTIPEWLKPVNAVFNGLSEVVFDQSFGTQAAIQGIVDRFQKEGRDAAVEAAKELTSSFMNGALKGAKVIKPFATGAIEEGTTQLAQNIVDKYTYNPDKDLMEGVTDAMMVGAAMTGSIETAGNIVLPKQKAQVAELQTQQKALLTELDNPNITPEAKEGIAQVLEDNQSTIDKVTKEAKEQIDKLNPEQKKQVEDLSEKVSTAETLVNDPNISPEVKAVAEQQVESLNKEIEAIKPDETVKEAPQEIIATETVESTPVQQESTVEPVIGVEEVYTPDSELAKVGTKDEYSKYLKSIFPDSEVQNVAFHDTNNEFEEFSKSDNGIFTTGQKDWWQKAKNKRKMLIDTKKSMVVEGGINSDITKELFEQNPDVDTIITLGDTNDINEAVYVVRDPSQIHEVGTKKDVQAFKEFVNKEQQNEVKQPKVTTEKVAETDLSQKRNEEVTPPSKLKKGKIEGNSYTTPNGEKFDINIFDGVNGKVESVYNRQNKDRLSLTVTNNEGKSIANAGFWKDKDGKWYSNITNVSPDFQRKGIASAMYQFAKENGFDIKPSEFRSEQGNKFTNSFFNENRAYDLEQKQSELRNKEVLNKANTDLEALKQVTNKPAKYQASVKRLNDAFRAGEITEQEFNDTKSRFDDVIADSSPNVPKREALTKEETTQLDNELKNENLTTDDFIQYERSRAIEDVANDAEAIQQPETDTRGAEPEVRASETTQEAKQPKVKVPTETENKVKEIQDRRQSIKDRISEKLKAQRGELSSGFDPRLLSDFIELGSTYIEEGVVKASDFIKRFRSDAKELGFDDTNISDEDITNEIYNEVTKTPEQRETEAKEFQKDVKEIGLTKEDVANLREELGERQFQNEVKSNAERIIEAKQEIKNGYNIADLVKKIADTDYLPSGLEVEIIKQYYASLSEAINKNPTPELLKERTDLLKTIDVVKVSQGRSIQAWDGLTALEDNLANFLTEESAYSVLTPEEIKSLTEKYNKAKEALDKYKSLQEKAASRAKNKKAQENISKLKASPNKAKVKEAFKQERQKFVEDFRAELRKIRTTPSAVILPYQRELIALAPFARKMVQSYVNEGIFDLKEIVKGIHQEFIQDIPELTEDDVRDILAGEYKDTKKTKNYKLAQIRDLERQAKLEREIALLEEGIIETKSPVQKKAKSDRIIALEEEIKQIKKRHPELFAQARLDEAEASAKQNIADLEKRLADDDLSFKEIVKPTSAQLEAYRARQKELRAELESRRKEEQLGRYSDDAKLDAKKKWFNGQIEKLKKEISDGNYETIEEPIPVLLDAEALKLKDEYMKFKEETRARRDHAEFLASSKWNKALDKLQQVAGLRRLVQTSIDLSIPLRQGISVMMNMGIPWLHEGTTMIGIDAYQKMLESTWNRKNYDRLMFDIEHSPEYLQSKEDGIVYAEVGSTNNENRDEHHRQSFLYDIPYLRKPFMASERAAAGWQNYARYQLYLRGEKMLQAEGKTRANAKEAYEQMAVRVMVDTGRGKIPGISDKTSSPEGKLIKRVLGNTLYGARLASAIFRKLNPLYYLNPKVDKSVRVQALKDMAGYTTGALITGLAFAAMGYTVSFDYDDPDFLKARKGKKVIDFTGGQSTYIRTYLRLITAVVKRADPDISHEDANKYAKFATKSVGTFFRNKLAPNTSYGINMIMGENTIGEKFNPWEIIQIYPMWTEDVHKSLKEGSPLDLLTIIPVSISGLGYMEYDKDIKRAKLNNHLNTPQDKKVISFLKEKQLNLTGDINQEIYDINTGDKTRMTSEQSDRFEKLWSEYIKDELSEAGEISRLSKLEEKPLKKEINKIKLEASKYAKERITGLPEGVTTIRDDDKTYELSPDQVKQRVKLNLEFIKEYGEELKEDYVDRFLEEGMSKSQAERKSIREVNKKANSYSKGVILEEEKDKNDGKVTFKEKTD